VVVDAGENPVGVDGDPQETVVEDGRPGRLDDLHRCRTAVGCRADTQCRHAVAVVRCRVRREPHRAGAGERGEAGAHNALQPFRQLPVRGARLAVYPGDRAARQDVVELHQQRLQPDLVELGVRVGEAGPQRRRGRPQLRLAEQVLGAAVALLHRRLAGVGAAVVLEVQLAAPHRRVRVLGLGVGEELRRRPDGDPRRAVEIGHPPGPFEHLPGRPAAAVAVPERQQRMARAAVLGEVRHTVGQVTPG
jgi:hypothetical protein